MDYLVQPLILLGDGLRALSLSGSVGNIVAIILYGAICLSPTVFAFRKKWKWENALLILLSIMLAYGLYNLINPSLLAQYALGMGKDLCVYGIYSVFLTWLTLKVVADYKEMGGNNIFRILRICMLAWTIGLLGLGLIGQTVTLFEKITALQQANTMWGVDLWPTYVIYGFQTASVLVEMGIVASVLLLSTKLLSILEKESFGESAKKIAERMANRCRNGLIIIVVTGMAKNVIQLLSYQYLHDINIEMNLPLFSLTVLFVIMALCKLLDQGKELKDDNDLFV